MITVWTVGHSTRSGEEFGKILLAHEIKVLVDVRSFPGSRRLPQFNREGTRIAFSAGDGAAEDLSIIGTAGNGLVRLTSGPGHNRFPDWSPDGKHLAFGSDRDGN